MAGKRSNLGTDTARGASSRPPDRSDLAALFPSAEEPIGTIRFEPGNVDSLGHVEVFKHFTRLRIDSPQIALVTFPGGVPQLSIDPRNPGDEAVGLDGAKNLP